MTWCAWDPWALLSEGGGAGQPSVGRGIERG